jgi:hypothetical protein
MPFPRALTQNYAEGTPNSIYLPIPFLSITTINIPHPLISNLKLAGYLNPSEAQLVILYTFNPDYFVKLFPFRNFAPYHNLSP